MSRVIIIGIIVLSHIAFASCGNSTESGASTTTPQEQTAQVNNVKVEEFKKLIGENPGIILDVRTPGEISEGKIPGALEINIMDSDFDNRIGKLEKGKPIYVYCKVGGRSSKAAKKLVNLGYQKVYNLDGGMDAWKSKGFEKE